MGEGTLLTKINAAVAAANEAEKTAETAKTEYVSRSKVVGGLLLEAKKLHPKVADFEAFLKRVDGLKLSRAYDYLRIAGGRSTDEELRKDARERQQKSRDKKKLPPKGPEPKPELRDVTESAKPKPKQPTWVEDAQRSSHALAEFTYACKNWLPQITVLADQRKALELVIEWSKTNPAAKEAA
jgi:hypothetical protein